MVLVGAGVGGEAGMRGGGAYYRRIIIHFREEVAQGDVFLCGRRRFGRGFFLGGGRVGDGGVGVEIHVDIGVHCAVEGFVGLRGGIGICSWGLGIGHLGGGIGRAREREGCQFRIIGSQI